MENNESPKSINGKAIDAHGNILICYDVKDFGTPVKIEKTIGLIVKKSNIIVKFRLVLNAQSRRIGQFREEGVKFEVKIIYLTEDLIDCNILVKNVDCLLFHYQLT